MSPEQLQIATIVVNYKRQFPEEYKIVKKAIEAKKKMNRNEYASMDDTPFKVEHFILRALYEIPETLSTMFVMGLDEGAIVYFKSKKGGIWFATQYPEFALPAYGKV